MKMSWNVRRNRAMQVAAAVATAAIITLGGATAANAAPTPTPVAPISASVTTDNAIAVQPAAASPDYAAGTYYYVCVYSDGSTLTLLYGVKTTTCHGTHIQQWLESGQFVKTYSLSLTGKIVKPGSISSAVYCMLAVAGVTVLMIDPPTTVPTLIAASAADAAGLVPCVSA